MGQFSWLYANTKKQMVDNKKADSYLLVPPPFQYKYGNYIKEDYYKGYGYFGGYDVYDLVAEWNKDYLSEDMLNKPLRENWNPEDEDCYNYAIKQFETLVKVLVKYKTGATDKEMEEYCKAVNYGYGEWKRNIGIDIACYDEQNESLPYPIKITSEPMSYENVCASKSDPNQGWEYEED